MWRSEMKIFQGVVTRRDIKSDFVRDFDGFDDLSTVVSSIAINDIKKRWITIDFDEI
jgi:hypothetical protein